MQLVLSQHLEWVSADQQRSERFAADVIDKGLIMTPQRASNSGVGHHDCLLQIVCDKTSIAVTSSAAFRG
jgi:hypothetical protein